MKKMLLSLLAVGLLAATGYTQTNLPPPSLSLGVSLDAALAQLEAASNYTAFTFVTYHRDSTKQVNEFGGGIGVAFNHTENAATVLRLEVVGRDVYLVNGNLQLSLPFDSFKGYVRQIPFGFVGGGQKFGNGPSEFVGIAGAGYGLQFPKWSKHYLCGFDAEYWSDRPGVQWRFCPLGWDF